MEPTTSVAYLRSVEGAVRSFRDALAEFLKLHVVNSHHFGALAPAALPRDDADPDEIARQFLLVSRAAGRAAAAPKLVSFAVLADGHRIDPIAAWASITQPKPIIDVQDVLGATEAILGRLEAKILEAELAPAPTVGAESMHPLVWGAASPLWRGQHYRLAVTTAADVLVASVRSRISRLDVADTSIWQQAFSDQDPKPGEPRLRWPGQPTDLNVRNMNGGLRQFAPGVQMTIRNRATHVADELSEQEALERLATLSLLARWVDACELVESDAL